jgi:hypothetical protein
MATQLAYCIKGELKISNLVKARFAEKGFIKNISLVSESRRF